MLEREQIINKLHEELEPLPFIYAFWLEGADSLGTVDQFSDIDLWLDVEDEYEEQSYEIVENALSELAELDYKYIVRHKHPKIRQRIYHLAGAGEYLMIDFCWQLHSRPKDDYTYYENDKIEAVRVIFDKAEIIRYKPLDLSDFTKWNSVRLEEAKYRRTQYLRAEKYIRRGQYLEAYALLQPLCAGAAY